MKYSPLSLLLLTVSTGSAFATPPDMAHICAMLSEFDCSLVNEALTTQQKQAYQDAGDTITHGDASIKVLDEKKQTILDEDRQFSQTAYKKACDMVLNKYPGLTSEDCNSIGGFDLESNSPLHLTGFTLIDGKTHISTEIDVETLSSEIDKIRQENVQHHRQALATIQSNDITEKALQKDIEHAYDQRNTQLREMRLSLKAYQANSLRKLAHLTEDDYIIPWFPCSAHTPHGQTTRCFSSSHHLYGITAFVSVSEQSNQMAAVYFPVGDGEVEDAYNNSQSDHAARWMADSADMHGDPVQAQRMREHIGVMSFTLAGVGNNPHIFMNQDKR